MPVQPIPDTSGRSDVELIEPGFDGPIVPMPGYVHSASFSADFNPEEAIQIKSFKDQTELAEFVRTHYTGFAPRPMMRGEVFATTAMDMDESAMVKAGGMAQNDFSETNVQVEGIDEADIIKTDGNYIYTVSGRTLFIIKAYPGEDAEVVFKKTLDEKPQGLFINNNRLAVFGNFEDLDFFKTLDFRPTQGMTYFNIYDITDKTNPTLIDEFKMEGRYFESRMIDNRVYFVTITGLQSRPVPMPIIVRENKLDHIPVQNIHYYSIPYDQAQFATINSINLNNPKSMKTETFVVEGSQNMYMSPSNIFITYTKHINEWDIRQEILIDLVSPLLTDSDKQLIQKINGVDEIILSKHEKRNKIMNIIQSYINFMEEDERTDLEDQTDGLLKKKLDELKYREFTIIHKIKADNGNILPGASGKVPGHIINQFALDENNDVLRIATTLNPTWSSFDKSRTESSNNVFTLDNNLKIIDELAGLAEDEQIYSTRFIDDRLYMVTFKQIDPFFVIDLSNPNNIKELGKLKIPGFSRYLHPYDDNTIIGIGRDATDSGRTRGLKISLFDVSDVAHPKEVAKFVTKENYAQSTAEFEHKAFLFDKDKELLVIPAYNNDRDGQGYNGAMVFKINKDAIELRGIVDHRSSDSYYGPAVERSLYIEELLYTKSPGLLRINTIEDLSKVKNIELPSEEGPYPIY